MKTATYNALLTLEEGKISSLPVTKEDLIRLINDCGFEVYSYSLTNKKDVSSLEALGLLDMAKCNDGFTYCNKDTKAVFYRADLSADEKRNVLSHELGHIVNNHISNSDIMGYTDDGYVDQTQEREANMFKTALLTPACVLKAANVKKIKDIKNCALVSDLDALTASRVIKEGNPPTDIEKQLCKNFKTYIEAVERATAIKRIRSAIITAIILILPIIFIFAVRQMAINDPSSPNNIFGSATASPIVSTPESLQYSDEILSREVVVTKTGTKFHLSDCRYVKSKDNLSVITIREALDQNLDPCSICEPTE